MGQVWELDLPHNHQSVALAFADHGKDDGSSIFPSLAHVAWKCGYSSRQVQRVVRELEAGGLLVKVAEAVGHRAVEYRMDVSAVPAKPPWTPDKTSGRQIVAPTSDASRGDIAMAPEPSEEPSVGTTSSEVVLIVRADDQELSHLLAELINQRDPKAKVAPNSASWQRDMRLLIKDRDGDVQEVERVLRWSQADHFWQSNILSPGKLRKQFTMLLLQCQARQAIGHGLSAEARARRERTQRRLAHQTNPNGGPHDPVGINAGSPRSSADWPKELARASGR